MGRIAVVAARTRVHRGDEHERAGKFDGVFCARDGYLVVLQRLAQHLESGFVELGKLVGKEHATVRKRYLTGLRIDATTHESHL